MFLRKCDIIEVYYDEGNANGEIPKQIPLFLLYNIDYGKSKKYRLYCCAKPEL